MIVVAGEALVDLVPTAQGTLAPRLGGGPYNVAVAAGRLDAPVGFLSRISTDPFGDRLVDRLHAANVRTDLVQRGPEPTTLAVVGLTDDGSARYSFYVEGTADRQVTDPGPLPADVRAVSFGTLSLVLEPGASTYERVLWREAERGALTVLDPNIRAGLIRDPRAYRDRYDSWLPHVGLLKVSVDDARWLAELPEDAPEAHVLDVVRDWRGAGPAAVVLTRGGDGLAVLTGTGEVISVPPAPVNVVDTIGAGDTVQGSLLAWLDDHDALSTGAVRSMDAGQWAEALTFAGAAAAITCSRAGAEPPFKRELGMT
ncbi:carbohydrate kinase [Actinosynnema sp. NPDC047251]|uniref:PfkB domain protein n=1 Tax=Saccharothrix espanaensis (strain ATCC 51144 / DSM 44229 / JCM 9112 / NBRC 15066 / NRRL 15764) TaxID=1179773 RepID=K0JSR9_SACES|nr:carbohydrate kinase [Saccharothrix espanaensis]CCH27899.1 PfkB domain protein [Saccharothrix espanaensis DSM 44229]